jgi:hypothetical protein
MLPSSNIATTNTVTILSAQYGSKSYVLEIPSWKRQQWINAKKQLPDFFTTSLDLNDPIIQKKVL